MNAKSLNRLFESFSSESSWYWYSSDGNCNGTELSWLPVAQRWVWLNLDSGESGSAGTLTLILTSELVCDPEHGNLFGELNLISLELDNQALVVVDGLPEGYPLPDDAEVFEVGAEGLVRFHVTEDSDAK